MRPTAGGTPRASSRATKIRRGGGDRCAAPGSGRRRTARSRRRPCRSCYAGKTRSRFGQFAASRSACGGSFSRCRAAGRFGTSPRRRSSVIGRERLNNIGLAWAGVTPPDIVCAGDRSVGGVPGAGGSDACAQDLRNHPEPGIKHHGRAKRWNCVCDARERLCAVVPIRQRTMVG